MPPKIFLNRFRHKATPIKEGAAVKAGFFQTQGILQQQVSRLGFILADAFPL
jgi:hypothetical protein